MLVREIVDYFDSAMPTDLVSQLAYLMKPLVSGDFDLICLCGSALLEDCVKQEMRQTGFLNRESICAGTIAHSDGASRNNCRFELGLLWSRTRCLLSARLLQQTLSSFEEDL